MKKDILINIMPTPGKKFAYYRKLTKAQKRIYDASDAITYVKLPQPERFYPALEALRKGLEKDDKAKVQDASRRIVRGLCTVFIVPQIGVKVLAKRPSGSGGEMHGLYEYDEENDARPTLTVWMRTAQRKQPVAFKTFLRTIVHEFMHHLDFTHLKLEDSFHTEGFYKRENNLVKLLVGEGNSIVSRKE
ncbi:MAG: hypothetical protein HN337_05885 [Deltaproteobacteria bacterium]|jgi:hypothetical protein|nr:hypothetical protein [Deltaproteobacteria bacterium]